MIEVKELHKQFGKVVAVDGVSFSAADGEVTALLGPNGAGKSTTLRIIAGAIGTDQGEAVIDGVRVKSGATDAIRQLGVLPYGSGLYPRLTGRENIRYFGQLHGLHGKALEDRVEKLIQDLGLEKVADRASKGYSQGERMKVAVARAIVHEPRNVILDEPTNGLDIHALRALRRMIRDLGQRGHCVLFSSHVMQEVAALCDRIVVIAKGRVVADGTPSELREQFGEQDLEEIFVQAIGGEA